MNDKRMLLEMIGIEKSYPGVKAVNNVNLEILEGEIHGLIGANGAGKSTLMKILFGAESMDSGEIKLFGRPLKLNSSLDAIKSGISLVPQETQLIMTLSAPKNIFLNREPKKNYFFIDDKEITKRSKLVLEKIKPDMNTDLPVGTMSVSDLQIIAIANAVSRDNKVIIFDEPTSALTSDEIHKLFKVIRRLSLDGISIVYISHRLDEVFEICDRITIMKDGSKVGTFQSSTLERKDAINYMVGKDLDYYERKKLSDFSGIPFFQVKDLSRNGSVNSVSFSMSKGEVLGIYGQVGSGRTEILRAIFGADGADSGQVLIEGKNVTIKSPQDAIKHGIGFLTEDRKGQGLIPLMNIEDNIFLGNWSKVINGGLLDKREQLTLSNNYIDNLLIKTPSSKQLVKNLSGGNQQKVILSRWLNHDSKILLLDEPTKGIDVGAKDYIYGLIRDLSSQGMTIILVTSEFSEITKCCDQVLVIKDKYITGIFDVGKVTEEDVLSYAL